MKTFLLRALMLRALILSLLNTSAMALNILIFFPYPSRSHHAAILALTERLLKEGHNIYAVTSNPLAGMRENYTCIDVSFGYEYISPEEDKEVSVNLQSRISKWDLPNLATSAISVLEKILSSDQVTRFIRRVKAEQLTFDVVLIQGTVNYFIAPFVYEVTGSKPFISFTSFNYDFYAEKNLGNILHFSYMPSNINHYSDKMNFWEKIENWFSHYYIMSKVLASAEVKTKAFIKRVFGKTKTLVYNPKELISISMVSSNHIYYYPRLLAPNVIELGPMHLREPETLDQDLQDWCDEAEKGVIYFSLGSNFKSKSLPENFKRNFIKTFKELPAGYRVVWKLEIEGSIPGLPENVLTRKWIPQQSLLAHPKIKLFITQGGLQSFQETVHYGVPVIGIPWYFDQPVNVGRMVDLGIGLKLNPEDLSSSEKVKNAVTTVLFNESYSINVRKVSAISRDFSARSMDTAVFWVEHVAKHRGAAHLKPVTADTTYFEFFCLDIMSFILVVIFVLFYSVFFISRSVIRLLIQNTDSKSKQL